MSLSDDTDPFKGIVLGCAIGAALWLLFFYLTLTLF